MTNWKCRLVLIDEIDNTTKTVTLSFPPPYKYKDIYDDLSDIVDINGRGIKFELSTYKRHHVLIRDWNKYVLNRDTINVIMYDNNIILFSLETKNRKSLITYSNIRDIYRDIIFDLITEPLLIYMIDGGQNRIKLIDVIDNPKRHLNNVITRLVKRYGY